MELNKLKRALRKKVRATESKKKHHIFWSIEVDGELSKVAKFSHDAHGQILSKVKADTAKRLRLTSAELTSLVQCDLSGEDFRSLWPQRFGWRRADV